MEFAKLRVSLTKKGIETDMTIWSAFEKKKIFAVQYTDKFGTVTRYLSQSDFEHIRQTEQNFYEISYLVWCLPEDVEKFKSLVLEKIAADLESISNSVERMKEVFSNHQK